MKKYKILIVEDQENHIISLRGYLEEFPMIIDLDNITIARTFKEARTLILNQNQFDISILDYLLDEAKTCLHLLDETQNNISNYGQIVFTTIDPIEHKNFQKFKLIASNYLILEKPFDEITVGRFIDEVKNKVVARKVLFDNRRSINLGSSEYLINDVNNVLFIEGAGSYCNYFILENGNITIKKNVAGNLDKQLDILNNSEIFLRVHKSFIVNLSQIKRSHKDEKTSGWLSFIDMDFNEITNPLVARYSTESPNYQILKAKTSFKKI